MPKKIHSFGVAKNVAMLIAAAAPATMPNRFQKEFQRIAG
jgi:hypothetical protein